MLHAAGELGLARADLYPKLALGGSLTSSTRMVGDIDHPNRAIPAFGPVIQWPLFDWGARHDVVDARDAALQAAVLAYRQSVLEGVAEAESALAQLERQQKRASASDKNVHALEHAQQTAGKLRGFGLADGADSTAAALAAAQARLERSLATHDLNLAFIALYKSFGGTLPPLQAGCRSDGRAGAQDADLRMAQVPAGGARGRILGLLLLMQTALMFGIFDSASVYISKSAADLWVGYPGTQSVELGRPIPRDTEVSLRWIPMSCASSRSSGSTATGADRSSAAACRCSSPASIRAPTA